MSNSPTSGPAKHRGKVSESTTESDPNQVQDRDHDAGESEDEQSSFDRDKFRADSQGDVAAAGAGSNAGGTSGFAEPGEDPESPVITSEPEPDAGGEQEKEASDTLTADDVENPYTEGWDEQLAARSREAGGEIETPHTGGHDVAESEHPGTSHTARRDYFEKVVEDAEERARANARSGEVTMGTSLGATPGEEIVDSEGNQIVPSYTQARDAQGSAVGAEMGGVDPSYGESGFDFGDVSDAFTDPDVRQTLSSELGSLDDATWEDISRDSWTRAKREEVLGSLREQHHNRMTAAADARAGRKPEAATRNAVTRDQQAKQHQQNERVVESTPYDVDDLIRGGAGNEPAGTCKLIKDADNADLSADTVLTLDEQGISRVSDLATVDAERLDSLDNISSSDREQLKNLRTDAQEFEADIESAAETLAEDIPELEVDDATYALRESARRGTDPRDAGMDIKDPSTRIPGTTTKIDHLSRQDDFGNIPTKQYKKSGATPTKVKGEVKHVYKPSDPQSQHQVFVLGDEWGGRTKVTVFNASKPESNSNASLNSASSDETRPGGVTDNEVFAEGDTVEIGNFATGYSEGEAATTETTISVTSHTEITRVDASDGPRDAPTGMSGQSWSGGASSGVPDYSDKPRAIRRREKRRESGDLGDVVDKSRRDSDS